MNADEARRILPAVLSIPHPRYWSWPNTRARRWIYRVATAGCALLVGYGVLTDRQAMLWFGLVAAVLEMAAQNAGNPQSMDLQVQELADGTLMLKGNQSYTINFELAGGAWWGAGQPTPESTPPEHEPSPEQTWPEDWEADDAEVAAESEQIDLYQKLATPWPAGQQLDARDLSECTPAPTNPPHDQWAGTPTPIADAVEQSLVDSLATEPLDAGVAERAPQHPTDTD